MEHSKYYYDYDRNDILRKSPFVTGLIDDTVDILDNNSSILNNIEDSIELKIDNNNGRWKYREDEILKEIQEYLGGQTAQDRFHVSDQIWFENANS